MCLFIVHMVKYVSASLVRALLRGSEKHKDLWQNAAIYISNSSDCGEPSHYLRICVCEYVMAEHCKGNMLISDAERQRTCQLNPHTHTTHIHPHHTHTHFSTLSLVHLFYKSLTEMKIF